MRWEMGWHRDTVNRDLSITGNVVVALVAFLLYLGATELFTGAHLRHALIGGAIVGVIVFAIALSITRMVGSFGGNTD